MSRGAKGKDDTVPSFFEALYAARDADANEVAEGLFLGAASAASDKKAMQKRRVSHVLIVHPELPEKFPQNFKYKRAPILDIPDSNILELLPDAMAFLGSARKGGGRAFVYCAKGISRSASVVIALLMVEKKIGFEEAFKRVESKRPIVYPNVGFQQQLRHLEALLKSDQVDDDATFEMRVTQLRAAVPKGALDGPSSPIRVGDAIGQSMGEGLDQLEDLVRKVCTQPQLLQKRELWKRHGLFFENLHKYKALPSDPALLGRAKEAAETLRKLPKIFADTLKGVKLALAVVKELEGWAAYAGPLLAGAAKAAEAAALRDQGEDVAAEGAANGKRKAEEDEEEDPAAAFLSKAPPKAGGDDSSDSDGGKKGKKKEKLSKKEKKKLKDEKKVAKAMKKAEKQAAKIEKAAKQADELARSQREAAEEAARRAEEAEAEIARLEAEEAFEDKAGAGRVRGADDGARRRRSRSRSRSRSRRRASSSGSSSGGESNDSGTGICPPPHLRKRQ